MDFAFVHAGFALTPEPSRPPLLQLDCARNWFHIIRHSCIRTSHGHDGDIQASIGKSPSLHYRS